MRVPNANAAMACAPPIRSTRLAPASIAAQQIASVDRAGQATVTFGTPATCAGITVITTVDASG